MDNSSTIPRDNLAPVCANSSNVRQTVPVLVAGDYAYQWLLITYQLVMMGVFTGIFVYYKPRYERLKWRSASLVIMFVVGGFMECLIGPVQTLYTSQTPCWFMSVAFVLTVPLLGGVVLVRVATFYFLSRLSAELAGNAQTFDSASLPDSAAEGDLDPSPDKATPPRKHNGTMAISMASSMATSSQQRHQAILIDLVSIRRIEALRFLASARGVALMAVLIALPFLIAVGIVMSADPAFVSGCTGCWYSSAQIIIMCVSSVCIIVAGLFMSWQTRKYPDPWGFLRESRYMLLGDAFALLGFILTEFAQLPIAIIVDYQPIVLVGFTITLGAQTVMPVYLARTREGNAYARHLEHQQTRRNLVFSTSDHANPSEVRLSNLSALQVSAATAPNGLERGSKQGYLDLILRDPELGEAFERHLIAELGVESLFFIRQVDAWKKSFSDISEHTRALRARRIFQAFVSPDGTYTTNLPADVVSAIAKAINTDNGVKPTVFDRARAEIVTLLELGAVTRFLHARSLRMSDLGIVASAT